MRLQTLLTIPLLLLAMHCAKESEENQFYRNEQLDQYLYDENPVAKETAIENWETFLKESQDLIFYSRSNLESMRYQIDEADGAEKFELLKTYKGYKKSIDEIEHKRQQRNDSFNEELGAYEPISHKRNRDFEKQFKREIIRINIGLGCKAEDHP